MTFETILLLAIACLVAMASPGPGIFALVSRTLISGLRHNLGFIAGIVAGDLVFVIFAMTGLAVLAAEYREIFVLVRLAACLYLIYLGIRLWVAHRNETHSAEVKATLPPSHFKGFMGGLTLTLSNPKVIIFYVGILPAIIDLESISLADGVVVSCVVATVLTFVLFAYASAATRGRGLLTTPRALKWTGRSAGTVMIGAGVTLALD